MDSGRNDFLCQYKNISNKLKKRFLRKPNVAEASEQFSILTKELQRQECPHYAAFCCLAVARCEHTLGNSVGETQALVQSARLYLEAEQQNHLLQCPSFGEHLNASISCYSHGIKSLLEQKQNSLAASLCLELGEALSWLGRSSDAIQHFQKAADLQNQCPLNYLTALEKVASCKLEIGDFDGALTILTQMIVIAEEKVSQINGRAVGVFGSILADTEVTLLLVLLYLKPPPQKLSPEQSKFMEKYTSGSYDPDNSVNYLTEDLILLLQSLIMACDSKEVDVLKALQKDLWPLLSAQQNTLLHKVYSRLVENTV